MILNLFLYFLREVVQATGTIRPMIEIILSGIIGGIGGSILTGAVAFYISRKNQQQQYYSGLIRLFGDNNWNQLQYNIEDPGLDITQVPLKINTICYQHLNIFLFAWLNRNVIEKDGSLSGWKNWAKAIINGARKRKDFAQAYNDILSHSDLYPPEFLTWLRTEMKISPSSFPRPSLENSSNDARCN